MANPPLPIGTWGSISIRSVPGGYAARARFRDNDGTTRPVERRGKSKSAARAALLEAFSRRSGLSGDIKEDTPLRTVAELWFAEVKASDRAIATIRRYREALDSYVLPQLGGLRLHEVSVSRVDAFVQELVADLSPATAKQARSVLSGVLGFAVRHDALVRNPVSSAAPIRQEKSAPRALTLDEVARIRQAVSRWQSGLPADGSVPDKPKRGRPPTQDLLSVVDLLIGTGARIGEVLALRWSDVAFTDDGTFVTLAGTVVYSPDPEKKRGPIIRQDRPKSDSSFRRLRLPAFAEATLLRQKVASPATHIDAVFPSSRGYWRDPHLVRKQWRGLRSAVNLEWVTPHSFRRTVATLLDTEADLRTAASQLGHGDVGVTAKHYVQRIYEGPNMASVLELFAPPR